jgi:ribose 5-phosphate isomerase A
MVTGMTLDDAKLLAAKRAVEFISNGMKVGLGTGSTATLFIRELGKAVQRGLRIEAITTSDESSELARELGIPLTNFDTTPVLDVNVDGADEIAPGLALIKGGHGAHLREKIVASAAQQFIVVADETKIVKKLGRFPLPVEVIQLALPLVSRRLKDLGLNPVLRPAREGTGPWITDEGNVIVDCHCGVIDEPDELAGEIRNIVGVVEHGLFLGMATMALVAGEDGVREVRP